MYVCMYVCVHVCIYICMYVCMYIYVCICVYVWVRKMQLIDTNRQQRSNSRHLCLATQQWRTNHWATAIPKKLFGRSSCYAPSIDRDTVFSLDGNTASLLNTAPFLEVVAPAAVPLASATVFQTPTCLNEPFPWKKYCVSRRCHQCWKNAVHWHKPTELKLTAPPPSRSILRRTNNCATESFPKNGLDAAYVMRRLPRYGSLTKWYHRRCPTYVGMYECMNVFMYVWM